MEVFKVAFLDINEVSKNVMLKPGEAILYVYSRAVWNVEKEEIKS